MRLWNQGKLEVLKGNYTKENLLSCCTDIKIIPILVLSWIYEFFHFND